MRLFVRNKRNPKEKIYLKVKANTRTELRQQLRSDYFSLKGVRYKISDVIAESGSDSTATGAVLGGVIGLLGGPLGVAIGAAAGGLLGNQNDGQDSDRVKRFNRTRVRWQQKGK